MKFASGSQAGRVKTGEFAPLLKNRGGFRVSSLGQCKYFASQMTPGQTVCAAVYFQLAIQLHRKLAPNTHRMLSGKAHIHGIIRGDATNTMLKAIKKSRAKKADRARRVADATITKNGSNDGLDKTWSISTGQSSDQDLPVSASAATPLRRNVRESKSDEKIPASTTSDEMPSLAGPSMAASLRRMRLKADLQLAKQKLELMNHYANDPNVSTVTDENNKSIAGYARISRPSPVYQRRRPNRWEDDHSLITESSRLPVDMTCDAYVADDMIEAGALVATCGIMSNFRPVFGSLLEEEEKSMVTDGEDSTVNSRESKSTFVNNTTKLSETTDGETVLMAPSRLNGRRLSGKSDRETILMAPSRQETQQTKLVVDSDDIIIGKYGRYVLVSA